MATLFLFFLSIFFILPLPSDCSSQNVPWERVDEGLSLGRLDPPLKPVPNDSKIVVVRINPKFYAFKLLCASEYGRIRLTAKDWCLKHNLTSAINAGMYQKDGLTNVGYMRNFNHFNNRSMNSTYKAVLAFNNRDPGVPEIQIIDLTCQGFEELKPKYQTFVQNIRMISCNGENVWARQDRVSSLAVLGMDKSGNALFVFSEAPYSGHDFNNVLLSLPISLYNAMYLEGGAEASLYLVAGGIELDRSGTYGTGFTESPVRPEARLIPNVIGIEKKKK
jgi:uncharacterized protein YigE (DUF2233 family)